MRWRPKSLRARLIFYGALAVLVTTALVSYFDFRLAERETRSVLETQMAENAIALISAIETVEDVAAVQAILDDFHQAEAEGHEVLLVDREGMVVASSRRESVGRPVEEVVAHAEPGLRAVLAGEAPSASQEMTHQGIRVIDLTRPVHGDPADRTAITGALHYVEPYAKYAALVKRTMAGYFLFTLLLLALLLGPFYLFLSRAVLAPVRQLAASNRAVAEGRREATFIPEEVIPGDEIGEVMRTRNAMLARLEAQAGALAESGRVLESMLDAVVVAEPEGTIRTVNRAALELLGYPQEELVGQPVGIIFEKEAPFRDTGLAQLVREGAARDVELTLRARSGERIPVIFNASVIRGEVGRLAAVVGVARDVRERKRAEEALRRYADEQAALYAVTSAATASLDPDKLLSTVLDVVLPILGADASWVTLPGPTLDDPPRIAAWRSVPESFLAAEESLPLCTCSVCAPLLAGGGQQTEPQLIAECPRLPPEVLATANLHSHVGIPLGTGDLVMGILNVAWRTPHPPPEAEHTLLTTIGRQVGLALHNAQLYQAARQVDRLRVLNGLDRTLAAILDPETVAEVTLRQIAAALDAPLGTLILCNPQADGCLERILTIEEGRVDVTLSEQETERLLVLVQRLKDRRETVPLSAGELDGLIVSKNHRMVESWGPGGMVVPIWSDEGLVAALVLGGRPIAQPFTDEDRALVQAAAARAGQAIQNARLYDELKTLLREREQAQAQLIHSEKMSALGRLAASIAHEINNPLQSMQGCLELTLEELAGSQRREKLERYLGIVGDEIERVATIVRGMRDFYRPAQEGRQPTDLHAVLESVLQLSSKQLQHSDVAVEREWADDLPPIQANADHLKQVFLNLVLNAIDAMPHGGTLRVSTAPARMPVRGDQPSPPAVRIEFGDTGEGMSPEMQSRLFEPFFTIKEQGSGLGLYISYGIIESHDGQITVSSEVGVGTTFTILLPVSEA